MCDLKNKAFIKIIEKIAASKGVVSLEEAGYNHETKLIEFQYCRPFEYDMDIGFSKVGTAKLTLEEFEYYFNK